MKALKIAALILGAFAVLLAPAAALLVVLFDGHQWRDELSRLVQQETGRSLKIEGELSLALFPSAGVRLGRATLSEHGSEQVFASVERARISLHLLPLLSRRVVVDAVELDGIKVRLVRFKDGRLNIDDLLARDERRPPIRFDVAGVKLANGELLWRDEQSGQELTLSGLELTTGRLANAASDTFELSARLTCEAPRIAARLTASGEYRYDLDAKSYGGANLDLRLTGDVAGLKAVALALGAGAVAFAAGNGIALDQLFLTARGKEGGEAFEARLEAPSLTLAAEGTSGAAINASIRLSGARHGVEAKITLLDLGSKGRSLQAGKLTLDLSARQGETTVKGGLASTLAVNFEKQTVELPAFSGEFEVADPRMPRKAVRLPLAGGLRADLGGQSAALQAHARLGESRIAAGVNVTRFSPLSLAFDLDIDRLDLDRYLPPLRAGAAGKEAGGPVPDGPLEFSAFRGLAASGTIKIGQLQVANVQASNVRLEVRAAGGRLDVAPLTANLYEEGSLHGAPSLSANDDRIALRTVAPTRSGDLAMKPPSVRPAGTAGRPLRRAGRGHRFRRSGAAQVARAKAGEQRRQRTGDALRRPFRKRPPAVPPGRAAPVPPPTAARNGRGASGPWARD